jgi:RNA polymerase sigma factor (TIGR02999 family)
MPQSITDLLTAAEHQQPAARDALFSALYSELHRMARRELARPGSASTLGVTTLLHEAYVEIASREGPRFPDRARFMAYAARVMRGLIIDHIRERRARKRGSQFEITALDTDAVEGAVDGAALSEIGQALDALAQTDAALAEVVDLKFFCGFSFGEIAAMRGISERTVQRHWEKARIYLYRAVRSDAFSDLEQ